jgi:hypothetical protein
MKNKLFLLAALALPLVFTACSKDDDKQSEEETSTILTFENHRFSIDGSENYESARFFSTSLNQSIHIADITAENAPKIDLGIGSMGAIMYFFVSPDDKSFGIGNAGATKTEYMLDLDCKIMTEAKFAAIDESDDFSQYTFTANSESFPYDATEDGASFFCFFKNAAGKMGVMKVKEIIQVGMDPRVVADIKMQK